MKYAEVAVNAPLAQPRTFTYMVPQGMSLSVGHAVWVPFGPRLLQGVVFELTDQAPVEEVREIAEIIDPHPVLSPVQVELARWMAKHYLATFFQAAALMLPPAFERRVLTFIQPTAKASEVTLSSLTPPQREALRLVQRKETMELRELKKALGRDRAEVVVGQLLRKGLVTKSQELERARARPSLASFRKRCPCLRKGGLSSRLSY